MFRTQHQSQDPKSQFRHKLLWTFPSLILLLLIKQTIYLYFFYKLLNFDNLIIHLAIYNYILILEPLGSTFLFQCVNNQKQPEQQQIQSRMAQQMKANLLIHIETNRSFIEEKVYDQFKYQCLKDDELKDLDIDKMIKVMNHIFDFGDQNPYMKIFFQRAPDNIQKFITSQYKKTSQTEDLAIDINKLIDVIYACVEEGFDNDHPKIEKQTQKIIHNPQKIEEKKTKPQIVEPPEKVRKFIVPKPKTPQKKNFIQIYQMPQKKQPARYLMHMAKQAKKQQQQRSDLPQVQPIDLSFIQKNKQAIQARLHDLYRHYCAQQQNLGQHVTFDRIKSQCQQMTIGKFLLFCKTVKIFQQKDLGKQVLCSKFKKVAEGKKQIQFDKFKELIALVDEQYIKLKQNKIGKGAIIPTYQARLMLQGNQYKKLKKDVDLPFQTRQKEGRQLKIYSTLETNRYSKKEQLTGHSGKFGKDLKQQIERKLLSQSSHHKPTKKSGKNEQRNGNSAQRSKIIRLDNLKYQNLPQMDWVLQEDQSDKTFMKQYRARDVVGQLKKRVNDLQKMQNSKVF